MMNRTFPDLGIRVRDGEIETNRLFAIDRKHLGSLAGARVVVTADSGIRLARAAFHTALGGPAGLITGQRTAYVFVQLADGTIHERRLTGRAAIGRAQVQATEFSLFVARAEQNRT